MGEFCDSLAVSSQARAAWRLSAFMRSLAEPGQRTVHINLGETCIKMYTPSRSPGFIRVPQQQRKTEFLKRKQRAPLSKQRAACSLVAFATDDEEVARRLPQILVMNKRLLNAKQVANLRAFTSRSPWLRVWVRNSAWVDAKAMSEIVREVGRAVQAVQPFAHCVLLMDCCPAHVTTPVLQTAARWGLGVHFVPACMTDLLQPLDVYVFATLKMKLQQALRRLYVASPDGTATHLEVLKALVLVLEETLHGRAWPDAFSGCGFAADQSRLGKRLLRALGWPESRSLQVSSELPTLAELTEIWPNRKEVPLDSLFALARKKEAQHMRALLLPPVPVAQDPPAFEAPCLREVDPPLSLAQPGTATSSSAPASTLVGATPWHQRLEAAAPPPPPVASRSPPPAALVAPPRVPMGRLLQRSRSDLEA